MTLEARPFTPERADAIAEMASRCTAGAMEPGWVRHVLASVIAGPEAVRDLWRDGRRAAVGVSIDNAETEGNAAELSVFTEPAGDVELITALLEWGESRARAAGRDRVDVPDWSGVELPEQLLTDLGFGVGHVMFDMRKRPGVVAPEPRAPLPDGWRWVPATADLAADYHATARAAFAGLPGAFVSELEVFRERLASTGDPPQLLLAADGSVAGFARVEVRADGVGLVGSIGRDPRHRGGGLGEHLMQRALENLEQKGCAGVVLEVAAVNDAGLALYRRFGFEVEREMSVYSKPVGTAAQT